jgi:hypothetical protein
MNTMYADAVRKAAKRQKKEQRKAAATTRVKKAVAEVPRMARILALEKAIAMQGISDEERNNLGASLLREKLAAAQELAERNAAERLAQVSATGAAINRGGHDPRAAVASVFAGTYTREAPVRSQTELSSQTRAGEASARIARLEKELRRATKGRDPLAIDRISQDITWERLRLAHSQGRI